MTHVLAATRAAAALGPVPSVLLWSCHPRTPPALLQLVMRAMDRRARECEAASLLLAALHPKLIDPQQVGGPAASPPPLPC